MSAPNEAALLLDGDDTLYIWHLVHFNFSTNGAFRAITP